MSKQGNAAIFLGANWNISLQELELVSFKQHFTEIKMEILNIQGKTWDTNKIKYMSNEINKIGSLIYLGDIKEEQKSGNVTG
jgi:hypothetical protein